MLGGIAIIKTGYFGDTNDYFLSSLNSTTSSCKNPDSSAKTSDRCQACGKVRGTLGKASCTYNTDLK